MDSTMSDVTTTDVEMEDDKITTKEGTEALAQLDAAEEMEAKDQTKAVTMYMDIIHSSANPQRIDHA
jgi:hypothetical protein